MFHGFNRWTRFLNMSNIYMCKNKTEQQGDINLKAISKHHCLCITTNEVTVTGDWVFVFFHANGTIVINIVARTSYIWMRWCCLRYSRTTCFVVFLECLVTNSTVDSYICRSSNVCMYRWRKISLVEVVE